MSTTITLRYCDIHQLKIIKKKKRGKKRKRKEGRMRARRSGWRIEKNAMKNVMIYIKRRIQKEGKTKKKHVEEEAGESREMEKGEGG